jgi:hypothetical protein
MKKSLLKTDALFIMVILIIFAGCNETRNGDPAISDKKKEILWKDIEINMSFDKVKELYPTMEFFMKADEEIPADIYRFDGIVIQKEDFFVNFVFVDNKIVEVSLFPKREFYGPAADKLFYGLKEELTQKYENPTDQNSGKIHLFDHYEQIVWDAQGVIIILYYEKAGLREDTSSLWLAYQPGEIKKEDNL